MASEMAGLITKTYRNIIVKKKRKMAIFKAENRKTAFLKTENRKTTFSKPKNRKWDPPPPPFKCVCVGGSLCVCLYKCMYLCV